MQEATMTLQEATALAALYRRERDDVTERLLVASVWNWIHEDDKDVTVEDFMQRPGIRNGLKRIEEMEAIGK